MIAGYSSDSPGLPEVLAEAIDKVMCDVHTSMPGTIVSYDPSTQTATVQPNFQRKYVADDNLTTFPKLEKVPVMFPSFSKGWLRFPLGQGDTVMLHFAERTLGPWLQSGGNVDPGSHEKFAMKDAVAVVGLNTLQAAIVAKGASSSVELAFGNVWLELTQAGGVKLTNGTADLLQIVNSLMTQLSTATAPPPSYKLVLPGLVAIQLELQSLLG